LSITGAPIRSESASEGIAVNIFDAFGIVQRIRTLPCSDCPDGPFWEP
jgi:hypothetical protein